MSVSVVAKGKYSWSRILFPQNGSCGVDHMQVFVWVILNYVFEISMQLCCRKKKFNFLTHFKNAESNLKFIIGN
jgi:hypothetical protein